MLLHHAPAQYPARAARQWIPPSIPTEQLASKSRRVSRQSGSPVDPVKYPASAARQRTLPSNYPARVADQWIPPSIPPEQLASKSRRVSRQSGSPVDPVKYPARAARQRTPPSIPPELLASGSRRVSLHSSSPVNPAEIRRVSRQSGSPVDPVKYPARAARQRTPPSIPPEFLASGSRRVSYQSSPPADPAEYPRVARQDPAEYPAEYPTPCRWILPSIRLLPSCFECTLRLGKGDAFVLLWAANKQLRLIPRRDSFWKGLDFC